MMRHRWLAEYTMSEYIIRSSAFNIFEVAP